MKTKNGLCGFLLVAGSLVSLSVGAQEGIAPAGEMAPPAMAAGPAPGYPASRMRLGLNVVPAPFGTVKAEANGMSASEDLAFAFGVRGFFDYLITPNFFVGFGPTYTFNVKAKDEGGSAAKQLDLLLRLGGNAPISDVVQLYGYLSPGYSIVMVPDDAVVENPKGLVLGIQAGAMYSLSPTLFVNGELGYQLGFHSVTVLGTSGDLKFSYMQVALGGGIRL